MKSGRKMPSLFWLLGACCSSLVNAQVPCNENYRTDHIEIRFVPLTSEIPESFRVTYGAQNSEAGVTRVANGGVWRGNLSNAGVIGNQDKIGLRLGGLTRHKVILSRGFNEPMEGLCYAVYTFNVKQTAWILEVDTTPNSPFGYRKNGKEPWVILQPGPEESAWNRVPPVGMKESLDIQVWEAAGLESTYLFTLPVEQATVGTMEFDKDKIAAQIVQDRFAILNNPLKLKASSVPPTDLYLTKVKHSRNALADEALKKTIVEQITLRRLKLKDVSEVSP